MDTTHRDAAAWIIGYDDYLRDVLGAADTTRVRHLPTVRRFIAACSGQGASLPDWTGLSVQRVTEFVREEAAQRTGHGRKAPACATRSFLRFLAWCGVAPSGFDRAIPSVRRARHAGLPTHLTAEQLARLLEPAAAPAVTAIVRRNRVRIGIPLGRLTGAHMLRHTAASRMVNGGASFKEVADVLGHRSLQTTGIYAKLDLDALAGVALPWIGGAR